MDATTQQTICNVLASGGCAPTAAHSQLIADGLLELVHTATADGTMRPVVFATAAGCRAVYEADAQRFAELQNKRAERAARKAT